MSRDHFYLINWNSYRSRDFKVNVALKMIIFTTKVNYFRSRDSFPSYQIQLRMSGDYFQASNGSLKDT